MQPARSVRYHPFLFDPLAHPHEQTPDCRSTLTGFLTDSIPVFMARPLKGRAKEGDTPRANRARSQAEILTKFATESARRGLIVVVGGGAGVAERGRGRNWQR
jgi:hypothetical protein